MAPRSLVIACGALAREILELIRLNNWDNIEVQCLPAEWHNRPQKIPEGVRERIRAARGRFDKIFVAYGDCGTGGLLDEVLRDEDVERIDGPHCYQFYAGRELFESLHDDEPGTFYLTDYLARHFETLIIKGMGLDRHPELQPMLFGNYKRLIYLAQTENPDLEKRARSAAGRLGLEYDFRFTGYGDLGTSLDRFQNRNHKAAVN